MGSLYGRIYIITAPTQARRLGRHEEKRIPPGFFALPYHLFSMHITIGRRPCGHHGEERTVARLFLLRGGPRSQQRLARRASLYHDPSIDRLCARRRHRERRHGRRDICLHELDAQHVRQHGLGTGRPRRAAPKVIRRRLVADHWRPGGGGATTLEAGQEHESDFPHAHRAQRHPDGGRHDRRGRRRQEPESGETPPVGIYLSAWHEERFLCIASKSKGIFSKWWGIFKHKHLKGSVFSILGSKVSFIQVRFFQRLRSKAKRLSILS